MFCWYDSDLATVRVRGKSTQLSTLLTYQHHRASVAQSVKIDQLFDFGRQAKQDRMHDTREISRQGLHVSTNFLCHNSCQPAIDLC